MKNALIIASDFLPYSPSLGGVIRILTLSDFLSKNGFKINILSSKTVDYGYFGYEDKMKDFETVYIDNKIQSLIFKGAKEKKEHFGSCSTVKPNVSIKSLIKKSFIFVLYKIKNIVYEFAVPDINIFMVNKFYRAAKRIIKEKNIQNVLISTPPHSMQLVGYKLKKHFKDKINLITDYRDSWNTVSIYTKKNPLSRMISRTYEKNVLKSCDHFTFVSSPMLSKAEKLFKIELSNKSELIMNGYVSNIDLSGFIKNPSGKMKIGYFGSISDSPNSTRNISNVLEVLKNNKSDFDFLEFHFFGDVSISNYKLENVFVHKSQNHKDALKAMLDMDFLLVVHSDKKSSDEVITGKFFEYVSAKKIVVCVGPVDMEAKRLTARYNVGINVDIDDFTDIKEKLLSLKSLEIKNFYKDLDVSIFKRDVQYKTFLKLLR